MPSSSRISSYTMQNGAKSLRTPLAKALESNFLYTTSLRLGSTCNFQAFQGVFRIRSSSRSLRTQCRLGPSLCGVDGWVLGLGKTGHPLIHIGQGDSSVQVHLRVDLRGGETNASNADHCHGDASRMDIEQRECMQERNGEANGFRSKDMEDES